MMYAFHYPSFLYKSPQMPEPEYLLRQGTVCIQTTLSISAAGNIFFEYL